MSIFDLLKKEKPEGTSDILQNAISSGVEKALAELEANIEEAERELDKQSGDTEKQSEELIGTIYTDTDSVKVKPRPEIENIMKEIQSLRADMQKNITSAKASDIDIVDPDKALASVMGLVSPTLE